MVLKPEDYEYSSHRGYLSKTKKCDRLHKRILLSMISKDPKQQLKRYRSFMAEDESDAFLQTINLKRLPSVLGESRFVKRIKEKYFKHKRHMEVPKSKRLAPDTDRIIDAVCVRYNTDRDKLVRTKRGTVNEAGSMAIYLDLHLRGGKRRQLSAESPISAATAQ